MNEPQVFLAWIFSNDIALQFLNRMFLSGDDPLHQVADGQHTLDCFVLNDREMAYTACGHNGHALVDGLLWSEKTTGLLIISETGVSFEDRPLSTILRA